MKKFRKTFSENITKLILIKIIKSKGVIYFLRPEKIWSNDSVVLNDNLNNKINANDFNYLIDNKRFLSSKNEFHWPKSNKYITENSFIDLKNKIAAKDIQIYFADGELGKMQD